MRCARSRRATRRRCGPPPRRSGANPKLDTAKVIMELGKGEALVSFLEGNGTPSMVERCMIRPPSARLGPITPEERKAVMAKSPVKGKYDQAVDSEFGLRGSAEARAGNRLDLAAGCPDTAAGRGRARRRTGGGILAQIGDVLGDASSAPTAARPAAVHRPGDRAPGDAHGAATGGRSGRGRHRQVDRRQDRQFDRPRDRARHTGRHPAA